MAGFFWLGGGFSFNLFDAADSSFALTATDFSFNSERKVGKRTPPLQAAPPCKSGKGVPAKPGLLILQRA
ncbi:MAG TPA: hypothetical protein ENJ11_04120 [Gammaproteobacteria bacterium]|nr:hypothetical protein [Gammaproteobacteria bacterium]